jgi:hypothetical protein
MSKIFFHNLKLGLFCHIAHLCSAHWMSGLEIKASHHRRPTKLRMGNFATSSFSSVVLGKSPSEISPTEAGVSLGVAPGGKKSFNKFSV